MPNFSLTTWIILLFLIVLLLALVFGGGYLLITYTLFHRIFDRPFARPLYDRSPKEIRQDTIIGRGKNWFYANRLDFMDVSITSYDGVRLYGYYRPANDRTNRRLVILVHGWQGHPSEMGAFAEMYLRKMDCHVLMIHMRAHGMSYGDYIGYGLAESQDLLTWIRYMKKILGDSTRILLHGWSMGAATILMTAGSGKLPEEVRAIVADCPFSSLQDQLRYLIRRTIHFAPSVLLTGMSRYTRKYLGYTIAQVSPLAVASRIRVPVLLFHGTEDTMVPPWMSEEIFNQIRAPKKLVFVQGAAHVRAFDVEPAAYENEVEKLMQASKFG